MNLRNITRIFVLAAFFGSVSTQAALAQAGAISLIRDAEIETAIRTFAAPILVAAGVDRDAFQVHLVADPSLNAFVTGGQRIFIHTGLLQRTEHPGQLIGVIAHEVGHISAGHVSRLHAQLRGSSATSILATLLGVAVGVATGAGDLGAAVAAAGQSVSFRNTLSFTRAMEAQADEAALRFLDKTQMSSAGMLEFMDILSSQTNRPIGVDPYLLTHPEPEQRVAAIQSHLLLSRYADRPISVEFVLMHERMVAKLDGFLRPYEQVTRIYRDDDRRVGARYARAIATFRRGELDIALPLIEGLIAQFPNDPYFYELKGDALFRNGRVNEAIIPYQKAVDLAPRETLIRTSLAQTQIETEQAPFLRAARDNLRQVIVSDPDSAHAWRLLTVAYGRLGERGNLALAQAEFSLLTGDRTLARSRLNLALQILPEGSPGWLRAQDLSERMAR